VLGGLSLSVLASWIRLASGLTPRWLLLDEINRMNAETVLGSLFTALDLAHRQHVEIVPYWLVEYIRQDKLLLNEVAAVAGLEADYVKEVLEMLKNTLNHGKGVSGVPLPYSWRAIATMNMVDRSHLFRLGFAFLRRFPLVIIPGVTEKLEPKLDTSILGEDSTHPSAAYKQILDVIRSTTFCYNAIKELEMTSNISSFDRPIYAVGIDKSLVEEALNIFDNVIRAAAVLIAKMSNIGVEIGPALLADLCRIITVARLHGNISENIVADIVIGSLLLPQIGAIAPAIKSELLFGGGSQRAKGVRNILTLVRKLLGKDSMSARYAEALSLELPLQQV
jgi:hypothetical protein